MLLCLHTHLVIIAFALSFCMLWNCRLFTFKCFCLSSFMRIISKFQKLIQKIHLILHISNAHGFCFRVSTHFSLQILEINFPSNTVSQMDRCHIFSSINGKTAWLPFPSIFCESLKKLISSCWLQFGLELLFSLC